MERLAEMNFCMPAVIDAFDPVQQRAKLTILIKKLDGSQTPQLVDVPVKIIRHGGYAVTLPIVAGDECLVVFADRCIDNWQKENGGVSEQDEYRMHDLSDAYAIVGIHHDGRAISDYNNSDLEIRNEGATTKVAVTASGNIELTTTTEVIVNAPTSTFNGDVQVNGEVNATGIIHSDIDVTTDENSLDSHTHIYIPGTLPPVSTSDANTP